MNLKSEINILILFQNLFLFLLYLYTNGGRCTKCHEYLNQERNIPYLLQTVAPTVQCKLMKTEKKINANYHLTEHFNLKFKHFVSTSLNVIKERIVSTHQFFKSQNCPYILSSGRPKRVNTETTETEISVRFAEPKPKIPNRNSAFKIH